ncbi:zinc carboxypeptidase-like [Culicoides brevitarsis]|uniref:zinc carboxypeptidase-like n=1 Tax=Culicoides brevitarsis TaxID=469753 RepID=UPI00307BE31F
MKLLIVLLCVGLTFAAKARFDNYRVMRVTVENEAQLNVLRELENQNSGYMFWETPDAVGRNVDFVVPPHKLDEAESIFAKIGLKPTTLAGNLQSLIDNEGVARKRAAFDWSEYHDLTTMYKWMDDIAAQYPNVVTKFNVGKTYEGRDIKGLKVSYKAGNPGLFLESNIHAREWVTSASSTWILNQLLTSTDANIRDIAENIDWYFVPVANPDGFEYTHTSNRMWRKTRKPSSSLCYGADPNRNFGYKWMTGGSSSIACSDTYAGSSEFSEPETAALAAFYSTIAKNITAYIDFHSYSQLLMYPYGTTVAGSISNEDEHIKVGKEMQKKIAERYGTQYEFGDIVTTIYVASGGSIDWVKGVHDTPFVFVYEMRDTGRYGFILPAEQIVPNAEETLDSLVTMVQEARKLGYFKQLRN